MSSASIAANQKVVLNFAWQGPNMWQGGSSRGGLDVRVVDLVFKGAKTDISIHLPENINPVEPQKFSFTCRKSFKETHPDSLCVTIEQVHNLTVKAGFFEKGRSIGPKVMDSSGRISQQQTILRSDSVVRLDIPDELELGQTYCLVVSSDDLSLSARLVKGDIADRSKKQERAPTNEVREKMSKMGEALIEEGMRNLDLASKGAFDSSSSADVISHGMKGVIRAGKEINHEINVPQSKPSLSASDLDKLTISQLQSCFETTFKQDKEFESQRMLAALAGNIPEMNRIMELEHSNSQLLMNLAEALKRKGVEPKIPQSASFMSAANDSTNLHAEALKRIQENCHIQ